MAAQLYDLGHNVEYIDVDVNKIPCTFSIKLGDKTYTLTFKYNAQGGFFTVDLETTQGDVLAYGDIIRYGRPLFGSIEDDRFPLPVIIPRGFTPGVDTVTFENFGKEVKLYLYDRGVA
ncbi:MAG: hypothetical protein LBJ11_09130 [Oscillospiraceae bacterium]|jgi:hypothetical protein|nr:hypothetical protein [Oscillospiraceae bacterium]